MKRLLQGGKAPGMPNSDEEQVTVGELPDAHDQVGNGTISPEGPESPSAPDSALVLELKTTVVELHKQLEGVLNSLGLRPEDGDTVLCSLDNQLREIRSLERTTETLANGNANLLELYGSLGSRTDALSQTIDNSITSISSNLGELLRVGATQSGIAGLYSAITVVEAKIVACSAAIEQTTATLSNLVDQLVIANSENSRTLANIRERATDLDSIIVKAETKVSELEDMTDKIDNLMVMLSGLVPVTNAMNGLANSFTGYMDKVQDLSDLLKRVDNVMITEQFSNITSSLLNIKHLLESNRRF